MATKNARSPDFKTPETRVSYAQTLFKARKQGTDANAKEKFGATLIFPNSVKTEKVCRVPDGSGGFALKSFQDIVADVIVEQWGEAGLVKARNGLVKSPFLAGDGKEARNKTTGELHPGMSPDVFFIRTQANADRPPIVSSSSSVVIPATEADVYSGCYGFAVLNFFAWSNPQNGDGISAGISMFFKKRDGDRLGGGGAPSPDQFLETVEDAGAAPGETQNGAGAGGLFG